MYISKETLEWESRQTDQVKRERELIKKVQQYNDNFAMKELLKLYRGTINIIVQSAIGAAALDYDTLNAYTQKAFKDLIIRNFDLNKQNVPNTYVRSTLSKKVKNIINDHRDSGSKKGQSMARKNAAIGAAKPWIENKVDSDGYTPDAVVTFVKKEMGIGKDLTERDVFRLDGLNRKEYSLNAAVGKSGEGEFMTLGDVADINGSLSDSYNRMVANYKVDAALSDQNMFSREERRAIRNVLGLGEFKNKKAAHIGEAALNAGISRYQVKRALEKLKERVED